MVGASDIEDQSIFSELGAALGGARSKIDNASRRRAAGERAGHLHSVLGAELALRAEVGEELTARDVRHEEVQIAGVLREALQSDLVKR